MSLSLYGSNVSSNILPLGRWATAVISTGTEASAAETCRNIHGLSMSFIFSPRFEAQRIF